MFRASPKYVVGACLIHKGSYHCACGESSEFLIEDNVSEIKCRNKECGNKFTMIWDNATDSYAGQVFEY